MMRRSRVQPGFVFFFAFRRGEKSVQSGEMNANEMRVMGHVVF
jgi:hypothetical protein